MRIHKNINAEYLNIVKRFMKTAFLSSLKQVEQHSDLVLMTSTPLGTLGPVHTSNFCCVEFN